MVEAVFEDLGVKKRVFAELDKVCKKDAVLSTNTSGLSIDQVRENYSRCPFVFCFYIWRGGAVVVSSTLDSSPDGPGFESRGGHLRHCVIHVSREFTHDYSRSTQPNHPSAGWQKMRTSAGHTRCGRWLWARATNNTISRCS